MLNNIRSAQKGISTTEYLIGVSVMVLALFMPVPGGGGKSVVEMLVEAFQTNHEAYAWGMSYPS